MSGSSPFKIVIAGIGGVGGFYGAKLAQTFTGSGIAEVCFLARGENLKHIREKGVTLITDNETITIKPDSVSDNVSDFGKPDLILFCCKSYDLESIAQQFTGQLHPGTLLLPLLNGVNSTEVLQQLFPANHCLGGCVYIVSNIQSHGVIKQQGAFNALFFGSNQLETEKLKPLETLFHTAQINATLSNNITEKAWEKFSFISPIATYTTATNTCIGDILKNKEFSHELSKLMEELLIVARTQKITIPNGIIQKHFETMAKLPYETTSSMQLDFSKNRKTELEGLTGYVVALAKQNKIKLDAYETFYRNLVSK